MEHLSKPAKITCVLINAYQMLRAITHHTPCCRFYPSCSEYGKKAIGKYGLLKGSWLLWKRFFRCQPFSKGGFDEVP
jgi:uncharacterized protein